MQVFSNEAGGTSVSLCAGDELISIPPSHRDMVTPALRIAFADPIAWFAAVAAKSEIPEFRQWLTALVAGGQWRLCLHEGFHFERSTMAAFYWYSQRVQSAQIAMPCEPLSSRLSGVLSHLYSLCDGVQWSQFGCSGGLLGSQDHIPLSGFSYVPKRKGYDPKKCVVFGNSACGDMLIYTAAGKAAWLSHETNKFQPLGTIAEGLSRVFQQLLENRAPQFDYDNA